MSVLPLNSALATSYAVVGDGGYVLVDSGYIGDGSRILRQLSEAGLKRENARLLLITHGHSDHYGSALQLREALGIKVAVHSADAANLREATNGVLSPDGLRGKVMRSIGSILNGSRRTCPPLEPDWLLEGGEDLLELGIEGEILHTPGHTAGSVSVALDDGACLVGDLLMATVPFQRPGLPYFMESRRAVKDSIELILQSDPKVIYPTHGRPINGRELESIWSRLDRE